MVSALLLCKTYWELCLCFILQWKMAIGYWLVTDKSIPVAIINQLYFIQKMAGFVAISIVTNFWTKEHPIAIIILLMQPMICFVGYTKTIICHLKTNSNLNKKKLLIVICVI
nr:MAG TPA: hypothetical protein [Caudoviricetes sp.]